MNNFDKYLDLFEYIQDDESDNPRLKAGFWAFKSGFADGENHPLWLKLSKVIRESGLDEDSAYKFTVEALQAMQDMGEVTAKHELEDISAYSEAPIYNSELMEWLSKGTNWAFVDDYVQELGIDLDCDRFSLLSLIQPAFTKAWEDHYYKVLEAIKDE